MGIVVRPISTATAWRPTLPAISLGDSVLFRSRPLQVVMLAGLISGTGDRLNQVALAALILALTHSIASAGLVFVVGTLPFVCFGLVAGPLVDRWDRRTAMVGADLSRAALVALIPLAATLSLPLVYALLFVITCARMVFSPAQQATVPDLVERDDLLFANALVRGAQFIPDLVGYPLAAALVTWLVAAHGVTRGAQLAFALDALSFLASAALLSRLPLAKRAQRAVQGAAGSLWQQAVAGLRFLLGHPALRTNTLLFAAGPLLLGSLHTLWIGFAWNVTHTDSVGYGLTEAANGAGMLLGLWLAQRAVKRANKGRVILAGLAGMGAAILCTGLASSLAVAAVMSVVLGIGNMLLVIPSVTLVQQHTPAELRGRVFSVRLMLTYGALSLSNYFAGTASDAIGVTTLMLLLGGGLVALAAGATLLPSARNAN